MDEVSLTEPQSGRREETSVLNDSAYLEDLRNQMLKFAILQLSDVSLAEEAVQEALMGALKNAGSFGRRAALKTWVFAILKNKIADTLRQRQRFVGTGNLYDADSENEVLDILFDSNGFWHTQERPVAWTEPAESMLNEHFWRVFDACLNGLPDVQARIFMMREFLELDSTEICMTEAISVSNLHVILHRARLRLRECLENKWFQGERRR